MAKQNRIKLHYVDDTEEEFIIHSNKVVEWIKEEKTKTIPALVKLYASIDTVIVWFLENQGDTLTVTQEEEPV